MQVNEIMTRGPRTVTADTNVRETARLMQQDDVGMLPVVAGDRLVGVVTDRDLAIRVVADGRDPNACKVRDVMSADVRTCRENDDVDDVMDLMGREQVRRVPIVDDRGALVGVVAQADVVLQAKSDRKAEKTVEKISKPAR